MSNLSKKILNELGNHSLGSYTKPFKKERERERVYLSD